MHTILVPVDFSANSFRALEYATDLAARSEARVLLFHAWHKATLMPGMNTALLPQDRQEAFKKMEAFLSKLGSGSTKPAAILKEGSPSNEICKLISDLDVQLVVMGTGGGKNLVKKIFGTTTEVIAKKGLCPVLVIPEKAAIKPIRNIVYASDFHVENQTTVNQLLQLNALFDATLTFVHINNSEETDPIKREYVQENVAMHCEHTPINIVETGHKNVAEGITDYVLNHDTSLLAFTMLNRPVWEKVMHNSVTSTLLRNLNIPMLALPENGAQLEIEKPEAGNILESPGN